MKIMFMGTPDFAVVSMKYLIENGYNVTSVVTQPDKPKGRGHKMTHPPVYDYAAENNINIYQPENLKKENFEEILNSEDPDLIVVVAYGKILPEYVLNYPKYGCINVHGSLLPKYRGAAPMQWSIIDGEKETGITTMYMEKGLDTGDMIIKEVVPILDDDNFETLHDKMAESGGKVLIDTVKLIEIGNAPREKQDDALSTYAIMIDKTVAKIDWTKDAVSIHNLVRGLSPFPKAFSSYMEKQVKIPASKVGDTTLETVCGKVIDVSPDGIKVACGNNTSLIITEIQFEGKKSMKVSEYLKGNNIAVGEIFG